MPASPDAPVCTFGQCTTRVNVARTGLTVCSKHTTCTNCGAVPAPNRAPDDAGRWCGRCAARHRRNGSPDAVQFLRGASPQERFATYVGPPNAVTGCTPWLGSRNRKGYGMFRESPDRRGVGAHRFALAQALGRPLGSGMQALHRCDNPPCVNPDHLYEGTHQENMDDKVERGRQSRDGAPGPRALDQDQLRLARMLIERGEENITTMARALGVSRETLRRWL